MPRIIDLNKPENDLYCHLSGALEGHADKVFTKYINAIDDLDVIFKDRTENGTQSPLTKAVRRNYEHGVRVICNRLKVAGKLAAHLVHETLDNTPLHYATYIGNPEIVKILLSHGVDPNTYSGKRVDGDTPLMSAIRYLTPYSLIHNGDWGDKQVQDNLKLWFDREIGLDEFELPKGELIVKWSGKLDIITMLLEAGADPSATDKFKISPWLLVNSLADPAHYSRQTFGDGTSNLVRISGDGDHVVFKTKMYVIGTDDEFIPVKVIYDVSEIRKRLAAYKDKNKDTSVTSLKVKELDVELKRVKEDQQPMMLERKAMDDRKRLIERYSNVIGLRTFYDTFNKQLNSEITVVGEIATNKVDRAHYSKADKVADGVSMLADLPVVGAVVGGAPKILGTGVQFLSDRKEKGKHANLLKNVPIPALIPRFVEDISIGVLHAHGIELAQLNAKRVEKLVKKAVEISYETLSAKEIKANTAEITKLIVEAINCNAGFIKTLQEMSAEQLKDDVKQAAVVSAPQFAAYKQKCIDVKAPAHLSAASAAAADADLDDGSHGLKRDKCIVM